MVLQFGIWSPVCGNWLRTVTQVTHFSLQYLTEVAIQADRLGYDFYYIPEHYLNAVHGPNFAVTDAWLTTIAVSLNTQHINVITATQPGFKLPAVVAKLGADIQSQLSNRHFGLSGIAGWWRQEAEAYGDVWLPHCDRYARLEEYLDIITKLWTQESFHYSGQFYTLTETALPNRPASPPLLWVAGESDRAIDLAARQADYLFINADHVEKTAALVAKVKQRAQQYYERDIKVAMSAFAIVRERTIDAEMRLEEIYRSVDFHKINYFASQIDPNVVAHNKLDLSQTIEANLGLSAQLIGDPNTIIKRLRVFEAIGIDVVMLKFESMLEDTVYFSETVISSYQQQNRLIPSS